jgi:L-alanine-DL-glutamate epimerase-like enolase superfamily enzyme
MKITSIEVFVLADPPASESPETHAMPSPGAWGVTLSGTPFVRIHTDEGISGLSEIFSVPPGVAKAVLDGPDSFLGRHLVGEDPVPPERIWARLYNTVLSSNRRGWELICIGAVDVAAWDIWGKMLRRPVYQLLGGAERAPHQVWTDADKRHEVVPYCTILSRDLDRESVLSQQIEMVVQLRDRGFRAVKIEPLRSSPQTIIDLARRAREALGPDGILCVDVGCLWNDAGMALGVIERLAEFDIFFFETPFPADSLEAYARLTSKCRVRIAAGEHTVSRWEFLALMDLGGVQVIQPYMTTVGGLTEARRVLELAVPRGVLVVPGGWATHVHGAATVQFSAMSPATPIFEHTPAEIYPSPLRKAIQECGFKIVNGAIALPERPGMGIELPEALIQHFRVG